MQLAEDTATGERVAIKFIPRLGFDELTVAREVLNQRACALHPNIIQLQVGVQPPRWPGCTADNAAPAPILAADSHLAFMRAASRSARQDHPVYSCTT